MTEGISVEKRNRDTLAGSLGCRPAMQRTLAPRYAALLLVLRLAGLVVHKSGLEVVLDGLGNPVVFHVTHAL